MCPERSKLRDLVLLVSSWEPANEEHVRSIGRANSASITYTGSLWQGRNPEVPRFVVRFSGAALSLELESTRRSQRVDQGRKRILILPARTAVKAVGTGH